MSDTVTKSPVLLYTEQTPNPESLKFVTNRMLYKGTADFREEELAREWSELASELFDKPYVKGVYICNNFVTVTKEMNYDWADIMLPLKQFIKSYIENGGDILKEGFEEAMAEIEEERGASYEYSEDEAEIVNKIKDLIDTYVRPAVEMDGGNITFKSYDEGIVTVILQGACSGCPSSTVTLKAGIEGMLKRMIPQVKEVVSEMG
ncbi:NifU family protein [Flavilitoribacter nigricans]|uniref:NifU family protein n=1 Tax=Flavilitoribacter nigricans (strain ATCC 23147 / DSM 23189 / NBRC 102662 / NCIMB 1420 / SS-2) TaxID=1122177 RepID=A0A2D0N3J3_FLAN2|nr:NifU family protein [Flavilitoribacter nigricans]PHN02946.1 NifU family protein [Flavilitoribacter nigricans DSM 23189 = NBRC 102662]